MVPPLPRNLLGHLGRNARRLAYFLRADRASGSRLHLTLLRRGFFSKRAIGYPFSRYDTRWFINDWSIEFRFRRINPPAVQSLLANKLSLHDHFRALGYRDRTSSLVGTLDFGRFTSHSRHRSLPEAIEKLGAVFVKPIDGFGGRGIRRIRPGEPIPGEGTFIVEQLLEQHPYAATVFPDSVNSLRVFTLRLNDEPPFVAAAVQRFGCRGSAPVDNFSRGGISTFIDLATGELSSGRSNPGFHASTEHPYHPDTGARFEGTIVPYWTEVKAFVLELMASIPAAQIVGWDICVTRDGPRLIEGNGSVPSPDLVQTHRPFLLDPRTHRFFRAKGILSARQFEWLTHQPALPPTHSPAAKIPSVA